MLVAYALTPHDAGGWFFENAPESLFCKVCGSCVVGDYVPDNISTTGKYDICSTYDNRVLVSRTVRDVLKMSGITDMELISIGKSGFYWLNPSASLEINESASGVIKGQYCLACQTYGEVIFSGLVVNAASLFAENGLCRSDICFGHGAEKAPIVLLSAELRNILVKPEFGIRKREAGTCLFA